MNRGTAQRVAVPAYFHPGKDHGGWATLAAVDVSLVVANVCDGPGIERDEEWAEALIAVRARGSHIVGYVDTGYLGITGNTTRSGSTFMDDWLEQVLLDIDAWYGLYGDVVTGIFFDEVAESEDGASVARVLRRLREYVQRADPTALTVLNPGAAVPAVFEDLADVVVTFEGPYEQYIAVGGEHAYEPLTWTPPPDQLIWHIIHDTPRSRLDEVVELSCQRGADLIFVTERSGRNPYDALPGDDACQAMGTTRRTARALRRPAEWSGEAVEIVTPPRDALISNPTLTRRDNTIEATAEFTVAGPSRRIFLASRRDNVPRWWTGSSPQIAADWLVENNRLYAYAGNGTDWKWRPAGQVRFEALGRWATWSLDADVLGLEPDGTARAAFHMSAPGRREYSEVAASTS